MICNARHRPARGNRKPVLCLLALVLTLIGLLGGSVLLGRQPGPGASINPALENAAGKDDFGVPRNAHKGPMSNIGGIGSNSFGSCAGPWSTLSDMLMPENEQSTQKVEGVATT